MLCISFLGMRPIARYCHINATLIDLFSDNSHLADASLILFLPFFVICLDFDAAETPSGFACKVLPVPLRLVLSWFCDVVTAFVV